MIRCLIYIFNVLKISWWPPTMSNTKKVKVEAEKITFETIISKYRYDMT